MSAVDFMQEKLMRNWMNMRNFEGFPGIFGRKQCLGMIALLMLTVALLPAAAQKDTFKKDAPAGQQDQNVQREKSPSLIDPAGPTISLVPSEQVFIMAAALNMCGYDEGLSESAPVRQRVRDEINKALAKSEAARDDRDKLCLYIAQHRMTGTLKDISQYISLALYLTPPPELETSAELPEMPPDSTQVVEILPILRKFVADVDMHGIWLTLHHTYDEEVNKLHDPLTKMIVDTNLYLKMPASTYDGRRFVVVIEPQLSPSMVNARIYGTDYVVVLSPVNGQIRMPDVKHTYLHYVIEPLLYSRSNAIERETPILKTVKDAPLEFLYRSDAVALTIECLIKAIEARTMDTGIPAYVVPANADRADYAKIENEKKAYQQKVAAVRWAAVRHDMHQGYVLTQYFYEQMMLFEHDPASLKDTIGEMVYSMDVDQQVNRAKQTEFDKEADGDVLRHSAPHKLVGLDLAESRLAAGDVVTASAMARAVLTVHAGGAEAEADTARAEFVLARAEAMTGHAEEAIDGFHKALAKSKDLRILSWSHIYLGRMLDLDCKREQAVSEYKAALEVRDGQMDTRVAAERGVKAPFSVAGHSCTDDDDKDEQEANPKGDAKKEGEPASQPK
jgi:tetratricopeptide (TPR) repeat protein